MNRRSYETMLDPKTTTEYHGLESQSMDCKDDRDVEEYVLTPRRKSHRDTDFSMKSELAPGPSIRTDRIGLSFTVWALHGCIAFSGSKNAELEPIGTLRTGSLTKRQQDHCK